VRWGEEKEEEKKKTRDQGRVRRFTYNSRRWRPVERVVCTGGDAPGSGIVATTSHDGVGIDAKESVATKDQRLERASKREEKREERERGKQARTPWRWRGRRMDE
jgi:hypothetical protein